MITTASTAASIGDKTSDQSALMEALSAGASVILRTLEYLVILKDQLRKKKEESMKKVAIQEIVSIFSKCLHF